MDEQQNIIIYRTADGRASVVLYAKDGKIIKGKTFACLPISHYLCNIYKESFRWYKTTSFSRH